MDYIMTHYGTRMTSLGFNCFCARYIRKINSDGATKFFDFKGSTMKGIIDLINNRFVGHRDFEYIIDNDGDGTAVNKKYGLKFFHELPRIPAKYIDTYYPSQEIILEFINKSAIKLKRFLEYRTANTMIFFRMEHRLHSEEYSQVEEFSRLVSSINPKLKFLIIYFSPNKDNSYCSDYSILTLKVEPMVWENCEEILGKTLNDTELFIKSCF